MTFVWPKVGRGEGKSVSFGAKKNILRPMEILGDEMMFGQPEGLFTGGELLDDAL